MYKPGSAVVRKKTKLKVWITGGFVIEGFAHLLEGSRESDYFEAKVKTSMAMTECKVKNPDGFEQEAKVFIINKEHVLFFQPLE